MGVSDRIPFHLIFLVLTTPIAKSLGPSGAVPWTGRRGGLVPALRREGQGLDSITIQLHCHKYFIVLLRPSPVAVLSPLEGYCEKRSAVCAFRTSFFEIRITYGKSGNVFPPFRSSRPSLACTSYSSKHTGRHLSRLVPISEADGCVLNPRLMKVLSSGMHPRECELAEFHLIFFSTLCSRDP